MKTKLNVSFSGVLLIIAFSAVALFTGCSKEVLNDSLPQQKSAAVVQNDLTTEELVMNLVFNIKPGTMPKSEIERMYSLLTSSLSDQGKQAFRTLFDNYKGYNGNTVVSSVVKTEGVEKILEGKAPADEFGRSVASCEKTLVVAASGSGKVYVYTKRNGSYALIQTLAPGLAEFSIVASVAVNEKNIVIGAPSFMGGQVFIYKKSGNKWVESDIIESQGKAMFGSDVVLKENRLAILSLDFAMGSFISIYQRIEKAWVLSGEIAQPFVFILDIDMDEDYIVGNGMSFTSPFPAAYIFKEQESVWSLEANVELPGFMYGSIAINESTIVANTFMGIGGFTGNDGKNYIIRRQGGVWSITNVIQIPQVLSLPALNKLDISEHTLVVTSPLGIENFPGDAAFVYRKSEGAWTLKRTLVPGDGGANYDFGSSVLLNKSEVIVGAVNSMFNMADPGRVYVYDSH